MALNLYIAPHPDTAKGVMGGIFRVIEAQGRWLPTLGVNIVDSPDEAQVVNLHAGEVMDTPLPIVTSNHGLYWTGDFDWHREYWLYNNTVIEALRRAHKVIVPSEWVAMPIRRDMRKRPVVIPHGIDAEDFNPPPEHGDYVLWAKPRVDVVSDPRPVNDLARLCPDIKFRTSYGRTTANVAVMGLMNHNDFQDQLSHAGVWLATTRETGDIASREAMAWGVPVLAWDWGGTGELVTHKETGWLASVGDYDSLKEGLYYCLENRERLGRAAREDVLARFQWKDLMPRYVSVYEEALREDEYEVDVSIIVPSYNYARYLPECLESINRDHLAPSVEIIVVDDASTDDTQVVLSNYDGLRVIRHETNMGLSAALNTGQSVARGKYISNLDADNVLHPDGFNALWSSLEEKPWVDVATGTYRILNTERVHGAQVDVRSQLDHYNQIPSTSMIRSRVARQIGGYRRRQVKNEDAEYWCRALSMGVRAEKVTDTPVFSYRWHGENKSALEGGEDDPDGPLSWNFYYPWRLHRDITPFAMLGNPPMGSWAVRSYDHPTVSVVVPVGPGHQKYIMDALDSVASQTYPNLECVVANDTGEPLDLASIGHPWVRVVDTPGGVGPAIARNTAIEAARGQLIVPLDSDDMLYPGIVRLYYDNWRRYPDSIVYADCDTEDKIGDRTYYHSGPWSLDKIFREAIYQDTIMFAKEWWYAIGGYPEDMPWEDWLFGATLHMIGVGATYVQKPWGVYRHWTSLNIGASKSDGDNADFGTDAFRERLMRAQEYLQRKEGEIRTMCKRCRKPKGRTQAQVQRDPIVLSAMQAGGDIQIICNRPGSGYRSLNSKAVRGRKYRFREGTILVVPPEDAWILRLDGFERYQEDVPETVMEEIKGPPPMPERFELEGMRPPTTAKVALPRAVDPLKVEREVYTPSPTNGKVSVDLLATIPRVHVERLKEAGFYWFSQVRDDFEHNGGRRVLAVRGIGKSVLGQIREMVYAHL